MRRFNTAITGASLAIGMIAGGLLMPPAAHAQRYLVNGHPATAKEEQLLRSYGFTAGAWVVNGWGISLDTERADFVPERACRSATTCSVCRSTATRGRSPRAEATGRHSGAAWPLSWGEEQ